MIQRPLTDLKILGNLLFFGFKTGDTQLFTWEESEKELYKLDCDKIDEHEDDLTSVDILLSKGLFVTGGRDGLIKVWNMKKQMVREIKFPESITAVCFFNPQGDILVGHGGKVSSVLALDYKPFEQKDFVPFSQEALITFMKYSRSGGPCSDHTFQKLKKQDDDLKKQIQELTKKRAALDEKREVSPI